MNSNQIGDFVDDITDGNIILEISGTLNGDYKISSTKASINQFQTINVNPNVTFATYEVRNNSKSVALSSSATSVNMTFTVSYFRLVIESLVIFNLKMSNFDRLIWLLTTLVPKI